MFDIKPNVGQHTEINAAEARAIDMYCHDTVKSSMRNALICFRLSTLTKYLTP
jgi:hypothetical protein